MADYTADIQLGEQIGNGHFGEVHHGTDPAHGHVAVKVLRRGATMNDAHWANYKENHFGEAQMLSRAQHRNVVKVHSVVEGDGGDTVLICMAYCPNGSLQSSFEQGPMSLKAVKRIATQITHGLGALHQRGMLHRDIKPANILLDANNVAQLGDFGLVTDELILGYGAQAGYSDHLAYEIHNGGGTSRKTDIWALGMTLYRLLHGQAWYEEGPCPRYIVGNGGFADGLKWLPHVPKDWRRFVRKMLVDDPARRYQTTQEVLNGIAPLAVTPEWSVTVGADIEWSRQKGNREIKAVWNRMSPRRHEWRAWSEPTGNGRTRQLGGSGGVIGGGAAETQLRDFLCR